MGSDLTPRQSEVLAAIVGRMQLVGPTVRELMPLLDVASPNGIVSLLNPLEKKGFITRENRKGRNIRLASSDIADGMRVTVAGKEFLLVPVEKWGE